MILSVYDSSFSLWEKATLFLCILLFLISSGRPSVWILSNLFLYSGSFYSVLCQARHLRCTTTFYLVVLGYDWLLITFGSVYIFHLRQKLNKKFNSFSTKCTQVMDILLTRPVDIPNQSHHTVRVGLFRRRISVNTNCLFTVKLVYKCFSYKK